jgi:hypothetical protein
MVSFLVKVELKPLKKPAQELGEVVPYVAFGLGRAIVWTADLGNLIRNVIEKKFVDCAVRLAASYFDVHKIC